MYRPELVAPALSTADRSSTAVMAAPGRGDGGGGGGAGAREGAGGVKGVVKGVVRGRERGEEAWGGVREGEGRRAGVKGRVPRNGKRIPLRRT
ncbi:hypothetical protein SCA03_02020 [Streptomyces cacaoi]|uniref:Uncharacterized protein n=1 Tax=Streptomyces cacaoi TaxID=1898 RepID=A0A4Y3QR18_STRCI|nr:hypothetical protein SCA03_02020 [Streptomyces cacaoi]